VFTPPEPQAMEPPMIEPATAPAPQAAIAPPNPLAALMALSEEERLALFT
jgi:hypothetical protein